MIFVSSQQFFPSSELEESISKNVPRPETPQRSRFTKEEDNLLKLLVSSQSQPKWSEIASNFQNRTARQCRERYNNYLRPDLVNGPWTKEEDDLLIKLFEKHGPKWSLISQSFNSRSSVNIKNHHSSLFNQLTKAGSTPFIIEVNKKETKPKEEIKPFKIEVKFGMPNENSEKVIMSIQNSTEKVVEPTQNMTQNVSETVQNFNGNVEPAQYFNEYYYDDCDSLINEDEFQNFFSNIQFEDEMWSNTIQEPEEDNLFVF